MSRPNVVFINTDQQSWDARSGAGNPWVRTPNVDRIYQSGVAFTRSYCTNPVCSPARSSWASGRYSSETGCPFNGGLMHDDIPDIGQVLSQNHIESYHAGKWHVDGRAVHDSFDVLYYGKRPIVAGGGEYYDDVTTRAVVDFLTRSSGEHPFYLQVGLINPHDVCEFEHAHEENDIPDPIRQGILREEDLPPLPENFDYDRAETRVQQVFRRDADALIHSAIYAKTRRWTELDWRYLAWSYYRFVERVDAHIGLILNAIHASGRADDTVIVFGSDHGEAAGRHEMFQKFTLYEESIRVPLVIVPAGALDQESRTQRSDALVSGVDLFATICDYAGVPDPPVNHGRSLRPIVEGRAQEYPRETVLVENNYWERAVVGPRYKLVAEYLARGGDESVPPSAATHDVGHVQLFDLEHDPGETRNLAQDADASQLRSRYLSLLAGHEDALERRRLRVGRPRDVVGHWGERVRSAQNASDRP